MTTKISIIVVTIWNFHKIKVYINCYNIWVFFFSILDSGDTLFPKVPLKPKLVLEDFGKTK